MRRTPCGERCLPRHPLASPPIHKFLTNSRCAFDTTPATMPFRARKPLNAGPCPATHRRSKTMDATDTLNESRSSPRVTSESGQIGPRYGGAPLLITPERMRAAEVESGPKLTTVERNGTKRNRIKSFATPAHSYEANQGHHQDRLAHRVRVGGVPNETTPAPFSVSRLGVNRAN